MVPRARVSVWPGRRRVPGIVAPDSRGARGAECLPRDVLRRSSSATSLCDGIRRADVCAFEPGPAPRKHAPPQAVYPRRRMGVWGVIAPCGQSRAGFSEQQFIILARKDEPTPDYREKMNRHRITADTGLPPLQNVEPLCCPHSSPVAGFFDQSSFVGGHEFKV